MTTNNDLNQAVSILRAGGLVAFPTETVYGLGADPALDAAVAKIFEVKRRPYTHPLIVHIADYSDLNTWSKDISNDTKKLAETFWPGPLTLILNKHAHVSDLVTGGQPTIAVRVPRHPVALSLLKLFGGGLVGPSANRFTHISPTNRMAVLEELGNEIEMVLDGGDCQVGLESTILDMTGENPTVLRPGMLSIAAIEHALQKKVNIAAHHSIRVPGMHNKHYAPRTVTQMIDSNEIKNIANRAVSSAILLAYNTWIDFLPKHIHHHQMPRNANDYAREIYRSLRFFDQKGYQQILIEEVPRDVDWLAIYDRLHKACSAEKKEE